MNESLGLADVATNLRLSPTTNRLAEISPASASAFELTVLVKKLAQRVAELEAKAKPPAPIEPSNWVPPDRTAGMRMPADALARMVGATEGLMADIRADAKRVGQGPVSVLAQPSAAPRLPGNGWRDAPKIEPPPGNSLADRLTLRSIAPSVASGC